jgi:DHA2 family multidrug resistance protein
VLAVLAACGALFRFGASRASHPIINSALLLNYSYSSALILLFVLGFVAYAIGFLAPIYVSRIFDADTIDVGLFVMPRMVGTAVAALLASWLLRKVDVELLLAAGFGAVATGTALLIYAAYGSQPTLVYISGALQGSGLGICGTGIAVRCFATLPASMRNEGAAVRGLVRTVGGSVGVVAMGAVVNHEIKILAAPMLDDLSNYMLTGMVLLTALAIVAAVLAAFLSSLGGKFGESRVAT